MVTHEDAQLTKDSPPLVKGLAKAFPQVWAEMMRRKAIIVIVLALIAPVFKHTNCDLAVAYHDAVQAVFPQVDTEVICKADQQMTPALRWAPEADEAGGDE